ncbi:hypothetical protein SDC9_65782 [bioreactor metagenome]|uniref:Uncharacterized protein n=1 Tax=bioreactor metagenome TaxID=1076179 RepID=A0A644XTE2_9ZZZZ
MKELEPRFDAISAKQDDAEVIKFIRFIKWKGDVCVCGMAHRAASNAAFRSPTLSDRAASLGDAERLCGAGCSGRILT